MIDVVYKLGSGSIHNNIELRYSLRSLKNFLPLGKVYVVGFCPPWINKENVIHVPAEDPYEVNKDGNLINKMILATTLPELSEGFVNMSDDQLFLQPVDYEEIKTPYIENKHYEQKEGQRIGRWQTRLLKTRDLLKQKNLPFDCFESHLPCLLYKRNYASVMFRYPYGFDKGLCGNTLYYNTLKIKGRELQPNTLARIIEPIANKQVIEQICQGKTYLNYTEKGTNEHLLLFLQKIFSEKSIYEL